MTTTFMIEFVDNNAADETIPLIEMFPGVKRVKRKKSRALRHHANIYFHEEREAEIAEFVGTMPQVLKVDDGDQEVHLAGQQQTSFTFDKGGRFARPGSTQLLHYYSSNASFDQMPLINKLGGTVSYNENTDRHGSNIFVSIIDQGVDSSHTQEFGSPARYIEISDYVGDGPGFHGTACASIAAGATCGFLKEATILDGKCFGSNSLTGSISNITDALDDLTAWAETPGNVASNEHVICNMSLGGENSLSNGYTTAVQAMEDAGIAVFAASGNSGELIFNDTSKDNFWPAAGLKYGAVGAVDLRRTRTHFSNIGGMVTLFGLGWGVPAATVGNGNYFNVSGTSFACPAVVGCYGTWVANRDGPRSQSEVWDLQSEFISYCVNGTVRSDDFDTEFSPAGTVLARADYSLL